MSAPDRQASFWCEQGWINGGVVGGVRLEVDALGTVTRSETGVPARAGDCRLAGVTFPAASNAHSHAFHRILRGRTHDAGTGSFWTWREQMYEAAATLTPDLYGQLATAVFTEMVVTGWTSVAEFHYVHHRPDGSPYGQAHAMERALARAAVAAGIRLTLLDTCYLAGGFGAPLTRGQLRFGDRDGAAWLQRLASLREAFAEEFDPAQVSVAAALHSVRGVPEEELELISRNLPADLPLHIHLSEQPAENEACVEATGLTPALLLAKHGLVTRRLSAVHATHLGAEDITVLGNAGATVVLCPTTEADLADGIGPAAQLRDAGARIALGTDQHAVVDPWLEMRALEHGERLRSGKRGRFAPADLHTAASRAGAEAQGRPAPGLAVGQTCDLMSVDPGTIRTAGSEAGQLALTATAADVHTVVVGGRILARNGLHTRLGDPAVLLSAAVAAVDSSRHRTPPAATTKDS
ncbi:formimidoylglutamate deiminase [Arthrobacter sp. zg-Y20]|uniref:formimidoylglutamate deiminase n=1 Tax=unclassified Arthrobacter TaxID=235627 RepID=UPI001D151A8B|nr:MULTISPECIES: formimidoylglutamate deiminase [unclassified Arthrobacter]MCC3277002.1 formimidoylglutamate deiminase [Arthrobacter sp. zg-Y20]MDK1317163.1 formimidoylglutamate deiminase [Arthrobacter sp. zg.Y20]WIB07261.1 formimidoylglutamate deiminase [Arthrobacter sp. zg-Y20]